MRGTRELPYPKLTWHLQFVPLVPGTREWHMTNSFAHLFRGRTHRISHTSHELYFFCSTLLILHLGCVSLQREEATAHAEFLSAEPPPALGGVSSRGTRPSSSAVTWGRITAHGRCLRIFYSGPSSQFCKRTLVPDPNPVAWTLDVGCFADIFIFVLSISYCALRPL